MRVAVIGAGAAGLVTARELRREGLHPVVLERGSQPGGTWVYRDDPEAPGAMYAALRTNLPRDLMAFEDHPFDDQGGGDPRRFPGHAEVRRYLEGFARRFELGPCVRLGAQVTAIDPLDGADAPWTPQDPAEPHRWRVAWHDAQGEQVQRFDAVAICNGHYHVPRIPALPGRAGFGGRVQHSRHYREPAPFRGRTVALLGAKASGVDLSLELAEVATRVILCGRDLPRADAQGPRGNVDHRPAIVALDGDAIVLADGDREPAVDDLLLCTGYRYDLPFLRPPSSPLDQVDPRPFPLYLDLVAARASTLALVGLPFQVVPFPLFELQARLWARTLTGRVALPDRAERLAWARERDAEQAAAGLAERHRLEYGDDQFEYNAKLARLAGAPAPAAWRPALYALVRRTRKRDPVGYRDLPLPPASTLEP